MDIISRVLNNEIVQIVLYVHLLFLSSSCSETILNNEDFTNDLEVLSAYDSHLNPLSSYIVVFGDTQSYTNNTSNLVYFDKSVSWTRSQVDCGINIQAVLQVGDVTENNAVSQWRAFHDIIFYLEKDIPIYVTTGNHDYDWEGTKIKNRNSTRINEFARFELSENNIISYYESTRIDNYIATINQENKIYLLSLEFGPREEVLEWASSFVQQNKNCKFILMTHEWLTRYGERISTDSYAELQLEGYSSYTTPEQVWRKLVKPNDNIICVLCGHNGFVAKLFSENDSGRSVPQILFNLQYQENGGNGFIQLWEIPPQSDSVMIRVYDTINQEWYLPDSTAFSFKYKN